MGKIDVGYSCPDCLGEPMQVIDKESGEIIFYCISCGSGPLSVCYYCLGLVDMFDDKKGCVFCLREQIINEMESQESIITTLN